MADAAPTHRDISATFGVPLPSLCSPTGATAFPVAKPALQSNCMAKAVVVLRSQAIGSCATPAATAASLCDGARWFVEGAGAVGWPLSTGVAEDVARKRTASAFATPVDRTGAGAATELTEGGVSTKAGEPISANEPCLRRRRLPKPRLKPRSSSSSQDARDGRDDLCLDVAGTAAAAREKDDLGAKDLDDGSCRGAADRAPHEKPALGADRCDDGFMAAMV